MLARAGVPVVETWNLAANPIDLCVGFSNHAAGFDVARYVFKRGTGGSPSSGAQQVGERFDHMLVDEYQGTNALQAQVLTRMKPDGRGMAVVGDDAQSIYSFRAATVRNILDFPGQFSPPARVVTLEQNYHSTEPILDACNAVIAQAGEGFRKRLFSEESSGERPQLV